MNDDVIGKVAEAIHKIDSAGIYDEETFARAAVAAHTDYLLALGGVTEDAIGEAVSWDYTGKIAHVRTLIARAVAQAVADKDADIEGLREQDAAWSEQNTSLYNDLAVAENRAINAEAEVERLRAESSCNRADYILALDRAHEAEADRDALRAKVARVEALCDEARKVHRAQVGKTLENPANANFHAEDFAAGRAYQASRVRAALADEDGDA